MVKLLDFFIRLPTPYFPGTALNHHQKSKKAYFRRKSRQVHEKSKLSPLRSSPFNFLYFPLGDTRKRSHMSHRFKVPFAAPVARVVPSSENVIARTKPPPWENVLNSFPSARSQTLIRPFPSAVAAILPSR